MGAFPTREAVATTTINTLVRSATTTISAGALDATLLEMEGVSSDAFDEYSTAAAPDTIESFDSSYGHLVDVFVFTENDGLELWFDEAVLGGEYRRVVGFLITPGIPQPVRAYRPVGSFVVITLANSGVASADAELSIRVRSL